MRHRRSGSLVVLMVVTLALASAGVLYAHWTKTLVLNGEVETGSMNTGWRNVSCTDVLSHNDLTVISSGTDLGQEEFAYLLTTDSNLGTLFDVYQTASDVAETILDYEFGSARLGITHDNVYPSYFEDCQLEFRNTGSIPMAVPYLVIEPVGGAFDLASDIFADDGAVWIEWASETPPNPQIDPGNSATASLKFHLEQFSSDQDTMYEYAITLCVHNWNEPTVAADDICDMYDVVGGEPVSKTTGDRVIVIPYPFQGT